MNQEIEGKLKEILLLPAEEAIKSIQELVCSTVPEKRASYIVRIPPFIIPDGKEELFNECRTEILKKWS